MKTTTHSQGRHTVSCLLPMIVLPAIMTAAASDVGTLKASYSTASDIGPEAGVIRRDPSDIIKTGDLYDVWFSKGAQTSGTTRRSGTRLDRMAISVSSLHRAI